MDQDTCDVISTGTDRDQWCNCE